MPATLLFFAPRPRIRRPAPRTPPSPPPPQTSHQAPLPLRHERRLGLELELQLQHAPARAMRRCGAAFPWRRRDRHGRRRGVPEAHLAGSAEGRRRHGRRMVQERPDNEALVRAWVASEAVLPVYCVDPWIFGGDKHCFGFPKNGALRAQFLIECLGDLKKNLQKQGLDLLVRHGKPEDILPSIAKAVSAHTDVNLSGVIQSPISSMLRKVEKGTEDVPNHRKVTHHEYEVETANGRITKRRKTKNHKAQENQEPC